MRTALRRLVTAAVAGLLPAGLLLSSSGPAGAGPVTATATFTVTTDWGSGYQAGYTVTNTGAAPLNGWTLTFDLGPSERISSLWNGEYSEDSTAGANRVVVHNASWNGTIDPGERVTVGFVATYTGQFVGPSACRINDAPCDGREPPVIPHRTVAYFTQFGIYARDFFVRDVVDQGQADHLDVINYAFGNVSADGRCFEANEPGQGDASADYQARFPAEHTVSGEADVFDQPLAGNFNQLRQLKERHPDLTVLMSLGGFTWSKFFSDAALTDASREEFVSSCIDLFIKGNLPIIDGQPQGGPGAAAGVFDGFDIDWEWPNGAGAAGNVVRPEDRTNYTLLLAEFRRQLDALTEDTGQRYALSAFLPADPAKIESGFEVDRIFDYLDWATVQGYDLHGTWETTANHQSALFPPAGDPAPVPFSVDLAISTYLDKGAPPEKLVLGVPFYGRGWTGLPDENNGLFAGPGTPAPATFEAGVEDYKRLAALTDSGYQVFRDPSVGTAWLFDGTTFWTFDDPTAIAEKMLYVKAKGLGGAMAWSLDGDDGSLTAAMDSGLG